MSRGRYAVVAVVGLAVLAGCGFLGAGGSGDASGDGSDGPATTDGTATPDETDGAPATTAGPGATATATVAATTTAPQDGDPDDEEGDDDGTDGDDDGGDAGETIVPGVTASGVRNLSALLAAHRSALTETGFRARTTVTTRLAGAGDGPLGPANLTFRAAAEAGGTPLRLYDNNSGGLSRDYERTIWANDSVAVSRRTRYPAVGNATTDYRTIPGGATADRVPSPATFPLLVVGGLLSNATVEVVGQDDRVELAVVGHRSPDLSNVSGTVVLDRAGRVRAIDLRFEQTRDGQRLVSVVDYDLTALAASVERPDWVEAAVESGGQE